MIKISWRKSWVYENIHCSNGSGEGSKRKLDPAARSVWDDYLDLATPPNTPIPGQVCLSKAVGYTVEQLSAILKTPIEIVESANKQMVDLAMITIENNGIVVINNYHRYQSEYERQRSYRQGLQTKVTDKGYKQGNKVDIDIDINKDISTSKEIYNYWNSLKIFVHKVPDKHFRAIAAALNKGYTVEEIKTAMKNYAYILKSPLYRWTYRWECCYFIGRGLEKFMDLGMAKSNYITYGSEDDEQIAGAKKLAKDGK